MNQKRNSITENKKTVHSDGDGKNVKNRRFLTTFICISLGIIIVFGGVLGAFSLIRNARSAVKYDGVYMTEGVASFFISRCKTMYLSSLSADGINASDTEYFWNKTADDGKTYGEKFSEECEIYLASIVAANRIFKSYAKLTADDKDCIKRSAEEILTLHADGDIGKFNSISSKHGFDFSDFEKAAEMLYCAEKASLVIYGQDGNNLSSSTELCAEFLSLYAHVDLAFVRNEYKLEFTVGEDGVRTEEFLPLTAEEKEQRAALVDRVTTLINNRNEGNDGEWIGPTLFEQIQDDYDSDPDMKSTGYYFLNGSYATYEFYTEFGPVVEKALEMEIGEYARVDLDIGTCFIYRDEPSPLAYTDKDNPFFSDFYALGAKHFYSEILAEFSSSVEFTRIYKERINPVKIPKNNNLYIRSWVSE